MSVLIYPLLGVLLAWPVYRLFQHLGHGCAWLRRVPGFRPRHLSVYQPRIEVSAPKEPHA